MLEKGTLVDGKYRILHEVGHGGMSVVYLALNERANKTWAIKEVRKNGSSSFEVVRQGLIAETNILKKLNHPHLPSIIDVIDQDDSFLVVMDYIEGVSLAKLLKTGGPQPWKDVVEWGKQLCDVLAYLHSRKPPIIYRDMKPDNVQLKPDGQIVLLDFGTAREYKFRGAEGSDTSCLGTRGYAAPEQYGGMGETDARTDIYCLGATMYHLLTGHNPSLPPYEMKPIRAINPALPRWLEQVILKCTQQDPNLRYQNCTELMYDLESGPKSDIVYRKGLKKKVALFGVSLGLTLVFALGALGFKLAYNSRSSDQYARYIDAAETAYNAMYAENGQEGNANYLESERNYTSAIKLQPQTEEAYEGLAALYVGTEAQITQTESSKMQQLLADKLFEKNGKKYAEFAFAWGIDLYFYYTTDTGSSSTAGSPSMAKNFLQVAMEAKPSALDDDETKGAAKAELAGMMYSIAKGQEMLNSNDRANSNYTYSDYWDDLNTLLSASFETTEAGKTKLISAVEDGSNNSVFYALSLQKSVVNAVNESMVEFAKSGISVSSIAAVIDEVEEATNQLYEQYSIAIKNDETYSETYDYLVSEISNVREKYKTLQEGN